MPDFGASIAAWISTAAASATMAVTGNAVAYHFVGSTVYAALTSTAFWAAAASTTYSSIQQRKLKKAARAGLNEGRVFMVREATYPRQIIYGQVRTSGPMVFIDTSGTNNEYVHIIVALAGHECQEITTVYLGDDAVTLDGSGNVTSGPYSGYARVKKHLGTASQAADSDLVSDSSKWTTNHRLRGVCYVYVRLKWNSEVFTQGIPNISAVVKGKKVFDPRTSVTAYSNNWALVIADYLTDTSLGVGHTYALAYSDLDSTALQAAANICDENVVLNPSGTEKRYTVNGVILSDVAPGDALQQLIFAGAGFCGYIGGKWFIHAGAYRTPTVTLDEGNLRGPISIKTKTSRRDTFNAAKGIFTSPENNWQPADYPPITNSTYESEDGERIWSDFEWPFTTSNASAQRLSKIALERARQDITVQLRCNLSAIQVQAGDNVMINNSRFGWSGKVFEVVTARFVPEEQDGALALGYDLELRETASGVWDWNDGEETTIDLAPNTNLPNPRVVAAPTSLSLTSDASTTSLQADGSVIPRVLVGWTAPADEFALSGGSIRVEYKLAAVATWNHWDTVKGSEEENYITAVVIGQSYDVRIRAENRLGGVSAWVSATITAAGDLDNPNAPSGLTATAGAGFISLDWADNTELDLSEYGIYRHTSDVFGSATEVAQVSASRFVDANVVPGTTYFYWVTAYDRSENESSPSTSVSAAATEPISTVPPSTPSAPTYSSSGTYISGDGTVFAFVVINTPALASGAIATDILYRVSGSSSWILADQVSGSGTARLDDLSPGVAYQFAARAVSNGGALSPVSTVLSYTAPNKTSGPGVVTAITFSRDGPAPKTLTSTGILMYAGRVSWTPPADKDIAYYEVKATFTNSDAAVDYTWWFISSSAEGTTTETFVDFYNISLNPGYVRIRAVDRSGNAGAWAGGTNINNASYVRIPAGNLTQQDANDVRVTAIETGNGASVQQVLARFPISDVISLTGGSPTETISVSLTNRGLSTKPDVGFVDCSTDPNIQASYDFDNASNSSTVAYIDLETMDGTNLPTGLQRFSIEFIEYL